MNHKEELPLEEISMIAFSQDSEINFRAIQINVLFNFSLQRLQIITLADILTAIKFIRKTKKGYVYMGTEGFKILMEECKNFNLQVPKDKLQIDPRKTKALKPKPLKPTAIQPYLSHFSLSGKRPKVELSFFGKNEMLFKGEGAFKKFGSKQLR